MGDALRDVDSKQVINNDFILMSTDTISNLNLTRTVDEHRYALTYLNHALPPTTPIQSRLLMYPELEN